MTPIFTATSVLTAGLLFLVQPMVARMVLPAFGGSQQVWTTAMLFFQVALIAGYAYTHFATTRMEARTQLLVHLAVLALPALFLPIALEVVPTDRGGLAPSFVLLGALTAGVAVPFVVVATSGPLLQRWFSWSDHPRAADPYFLYAAGNIGSLGGLLAYPLLAEPLFSVEEQVRLWAGGYGLAFVLIGACAASVWKSSGETQTVSTTATRSPVSLQQTGEWLFLAFVPSSLMLGVTSRLSTDIAVVPFLWVLPLSAYIATFTLAFSRFGEPALRLAKRLAPAVVVAAVAIDPATLGVTTAVCVQLLLVLVGGALAHGKLAENRPAPDRLTYFYLTVAIGGALGGAFNGLVAPVLFPTVFEYGIVAALTLGIAIQWREVLVGADRWPALLRLPAALTLFVLPMAIFLLSATRALPSTPGLTLAVLLLMLAPLMTRVGHSGAVGLAVAIVALAPPALQVTRAEHIERTFFGVHRVNREGAVLELIHGNTVHGTQNTESPEARRTPTSYYHPEGPLGDIMQRYGDLDTIGIIGLGAGGMVTYGRSDQAIDFYEIDPAVARIAEERFTYLSDTPATVGIVIGDGRLTISEVSNAYEMLILDVFASDAVPVHLLTLEAFQEYLEALEPNGLMVMNASNRYLDLRLVVSAIADEVGLTALHRDYDGAAPGSLPSRWIVLSEDPGRVAPLREAGWTELPPSNHLWTDQRSSVWAVLTR